ncbi:MAG: TIGR04086 family membrane protein [Eubacteriales bacterium]
MYKPKNRRVPVQRSKPVTIIKGVVCGYIITILMLIFLAFLLYKFDISSSQIYIGVVITYIFSTLVTGLITGKGVQENAWLWGCFAGFVYFIILILVSVIVNQNLSSTKEIFTMLGLCLGGGTLGGMFS